MLRGNLLVKGENGEYLEFGPFNVTARQSEISEQLRSFFSFFSFFLKLAPAIRKGKKGKNRYNAGGI